MTVAKMELFGVAKMELNGKINLIVPKVELKKQQKGGIE